jgi:predicted Ser/Thr protein kinase
MKIFILFTLLLTGHTMLAQSETPPCTGLPVAVPEMRAVCKTNDLARYFEVRNAEKLKKGTHSAVYKLTVDCNGTAIYAAFQRGTFSEEDQLNYENQIMELTWNPAQQKSEAVTSTVFITLEIVNGKFTVVVQ